MTPPFPTKVVTPAHSLDLPHRVAHVVASPYDRHLVAFSPEEAEISVITEAGTCQQVDLLLPTGSLCMTLNATGTLLAFANSGEKQVQLLILDSKDRTYLELESEVIDVRFDRLGRLWIVRLCFENFVVELRSGSNWQLVATAEVGDVRFCEGGATLRLASTGNAMFVEVFSGQSEQEIYHCEFADHRLTAQRLSQLNGEPFIFASPLCPSIVALDHAECAFHCVQPPWEEILESISWPDYEEGESEDERPGYYGCHLDEHHFFGSSSEGRLFLFELSPLMVRREIHIAGHLPVPASEKHPTLSDAQGWVSDLTMFGLCGDSVVLFFAKNRHSLPQAVFVPVVRLLE